jgi:hypothetical protein
MPGFDTYKILTEIVIDNYCYKVTQSSATGAGCVLWIKDANVMDHFEALGRFSEFDKRQVLEFIVRYTTNHLFRKEISKRRFMNYLENLSPTVFEDIECLSYQEKVRAFHNLYDLDSLLDIYLDLGWKRKTMAKKFHPDLGGDTRTMALINEGYEVLKDCLSKDPSKST